MKMKKLIFILICFVSILEGSFWWGQIKYPGNWDPVPTVYVDVINVLTLTTSVRCIPEKVVIDVNSPDFAVNLAKMPFVILVGDDELKFSSEQIEVLRNYVINGGSIFIEDVSELRYSKFDVAVRDLLKRMFPEYKLKKTDKNNVLLKSFYLLTKVVGRVNMYDYLEYVEYENRPVIIYSRNNIISCWARDKFGKFLFECFPEGEKQRFEAQKLFLNIIMYSLCGTYKSDQVHQKFIEEKLRFKKW